MKIKELLNLKNIKTKIMSELDSSMHRLRTGRDGYDPEPKLDRQVYYDEQEQRIVREDYGALSHPETTIPRGTGEQLTGSGEIGLNFVNPSFIGYEITIKPLNYGFLVNVGCQTLAIETSEKLVAWLGHYYKNPSEVQKEWFSGEFVKKNK